MRILPAGNFAFQRASARHGKVGSSPHSKYLGGCKKVAFRIAQPCTAGAAAAAALPRVRRSNDTFCATSARHGRCGAGTQLPHAFAGIREHVRRVRLPAGAHLPRLRLSDVIHVPIEP